MTTIEIYYWEKPKDLQKTIVVSDEWGAVMNTVWDFPCTVYPDTSVAVVHVLDKQGFKKVLKLICEELEVVSAC